MGADVLSKITDRRYVEYPVSIFPVWIFCYLFVFFGKLHLEKNSVCVGGGCVCVGVCGGGGVRGHICLEFLYAYHEETASSSICLLISRALHMVFSDRQKPTTSF